jgi:micrococcal nuclease
VAEKRFHYRALIRSVHDGDTCTLDIDLGFNLWLRNQSCRLLGINAPELPGVEGVAARAWLRERLPLDGYVYVVTDLDRDEKYGRTLVTLYTDSRFRPPSLNALMVKQGYAKEYP